MESKADKTALTAYVPLTKLTEYMTSVNIDNNYIKKSDVDNNYVKKSELNTLVDLSKYTTTVDMNKAISTAVAGTVTETKVNSLISTAVNGLVNESKVNTLISSALTSYLKKADLKQANYDAGFHSDWFGTEAQYSSTSHDANVNYHTKEEG